MVVTNFSENFLLVDFLYINASRRIPSQNITLKVGITNVYVQYYLNIYHNVSLRYFFRALTWYHNGNKLTPGGRIILSSDNTTLTVINSTAADSGVYVARFDGLLIHPYSRSCEEAVLDLLRHYPVLKPAVFYVGTTSTGELRIKIIGILCKNEARLGWCMKVSFHFCTCRV